MCQINFLGQTPTSPISSAFCGVRYVLNIVGTHENLGAPTRLVSRVENFKHLISPEKMANPMNNPIIILANLGTSNEHLGESQERKNIRTSWKFPRKPLEIPGEFLAHLWKI